MGRARRAWSANRSTSAIEGVGELAQSRGGCARERAAARLRPPRSGSPAAARRGHERRAVRLGFRHARVLVGRRHPEAARVGRRARRELVAWKLERIHPDDVERVRARSRRARVSKAMAWTAEYRFRRHDGSVHSTSSDRGYFLRDVDGRAYRIIGIDPRRQAIKAVRSHARSRRAPRPRRASRAKDEFLAMLGHELRNPLAPIVTALELLRMRGAARRRRERRACIERQAQHLSRLVDDLLDVSRITRGKMRARAASTLELAERASRRAIETARPAARAARSTRLDVDVPRAGWSSTPTARASRRSSRTC